MLEAKTAVRNVVLGLLALFLLLSALFIGYGGRNDAGLKPSARTETAQSQATQTQETQEAQTQETQAGAQKDAESQQAGAGDAAASADGTGEAASKDAGDNQAPDAASVEDASPVVQRIFDAQDGAAVFAQACQACHIAGGVGVEATDGAGQKNYPALANNPRLESPQYPLTFILNGAGGMPSFAADLTDEQIAAVVNYLRHDLNQFSGDTTPEDVKKNRPTGPTKALGGGAG